MSVQGRKRVKREKEHEVHSALFIRTRKALKKLLPLAQQTLSDPWPRAEHTVTNNFSES